MRVRPLTTLVLRARRWFIEHVQENTVNMMLEIRVLRLQSLGLTRVQAKTAILVGMTDAQILDATARGEYP